MSDEILSAERLAEMASKIGTPNWVQKIVRSHEALRAALDEAEDFRAEIALDAFTAPDADWGTILDSLRARVRDLGGGIPEEGECQRCGGIGCEACDARVALAFPAEVRGE